jgi:hypothetical protein
MAFGRRQVNQAVMDKQSTMVQYHALVLLHEIKQNDRHAPARARARLAVAPALHV